MNYYQNNSYQYNNFNSPYMKPKPSPLSVASLVCGILSVLCCCFGYAGAVFGAVAVIIAVIVKKEKGKLDPLTVTGLSLGIFGAVISIITIVSIYLIPSETFEEYFKSYYEQFEQFDKNGTNVDPNV